MQFARTAADAITTLWTYTPDNMDKLPDRSAGYLGGDFANEYRPWERGEPLRYAHLFRSTTPPER